MGKKVREYKSGDFIFAKVKGYPAWPARVQKANGKKYFVYFYGTGETANLSPAMIFDYAENKDKFLTKTVKRRDFNDGVKQIEHDFANNVPLEQVIGVPMEVPPAETSTNDSANDSTTNDTMDDTAVDTTAADDTMADDTTLNATQNDTAVEDSDDTGNLVIDEGKQKQTKKGKTDVKAKETPSKPAKEPKTPRSKAKKDEPAKEDDEEKKEEEIVSRSGRKIRPKRYIDEQTEDNATLPSPAPKKRRGGSPAPSDKDKPDKDKLPEKSVKQFNAVSQSDLEDLKEPFKPGTTDTKISRTSICEEVNELIRDVPDEKLEALSKHIRFIMQIYLSNDKKDEIFLKFWEMDDICAENSQFSLKDDIFSQYDDNFVTEDCLKSYESNIGSQNVDKREEDAEKENILIAYLPSGQYIGIKLFQSRPNSFKNEASRLQWDKQAASNALTLKSQLEKGHITTQSVLAQLVTDLNLTDEEKATLDKERETEEKKSRVQFLKTEMKLIELDAKIKTCLSLEKADTDMCLKLLDELIELDIKPLMLLKHPTCLETIKRMRAYVGNTPSWELSESAALVFTKQAHKIRKQADSVYKKMKDLFTPLEGLSFWEYFTNRVLKFKKVTSNLSADELLEMIHEPLEMSVPTMHSMKEAVDAANEAEQLESTQPEEDDKAKKKSTPAKTKKAANSTSKTPVKRQSSRKLQQEEKEKEQEAETQNETQLTPDTEELASKPAESEETAEKQDEIREKTPEIAPEEEKPSESPPEDTEPSKEENGEVEKNDTEKNLENDAEKTEKVKEKEDVGEPRAKRSRESKKTEPPPPRSPAKRKSKF
uniref:PWWP domain-containing protein n=1 Tax=Heliothis virescens TaxID=7102 RepID=A0A2A4JE44_HELVI